MRLKEFFILVLVCVSVGISFGQKSNKKIKITGYVVDKAQSPIVNAIVMIDNKKTDSRPHKPSL